MKKLLSLQLLLLLCFTAFSQAGYLLPVATEDDKWGYIDSMGNQIIDFKYDQAFQFYEERALVAIKENDSYKYSYIDVKGNLYGNWNFVEAQSYHDGYALVRFYIDDNTLSYGYLNKKGVISPPISCGDARSFSGGLAPVSKLTGWGFVNKDFKEVIQGRYSATGSFQQGLCAVAFGADSLQRWGYINAKGQLVTSVTYLQASGFSNNMAAVGLLVEEKVGKKNVKRNLFGYVGGNGDFLIPAKFQQASDFSESLAHVKHNGEEMYIDGMGNKVFSLDSAFNGSNFHYGYAVAYTPGGNAFFLDKKGAIAYDFNFTSLTDFINGYSWFTRRNGSKGYLDYNGNIIWQDGQATHKR